MEAVTFKKLVKGHAYSVTGAKQVPRGPSPQAVPASPPALASLAGDQGCGWGWLSCSRTLSVSGGPYPEASISSCPDSLQFAYVAAFLSGNPLALLLVSGVCCGAGR